MEKFERAIELEKKRYVDPDVRQAILKAYTLSSDATRPPPINVLPMVNKALALYQWKQDINAASKLCEEALVIDPECDAAIATLAQLYLQNSRLDDAIDMFERHAKIARTGAELEQCFTFEFVSVSSLSVTSVLSNWKCRRHGHKKSSGRTIPFRRGSWSRWPRIWLGRGHHL